MINSSLLKRNLFGFLSLYFIATICFSQNLRPRVIVTTDGEADDRASMVRFLLTSNEFDIEGIINSSSQFHWVGGEGWNAFHDVNWIKEYIDYYSQVYDNLKLHDPNYPSPEYLLSKWKVGNTNGVGEDSDRTEGANLIVETLLQSDARPVWIQAWGGTNTISRALKIIEEDHPEKMTDVASKIRLFLIWEQDETYQNYIRPNWEKYNIPVIISDQFDCMAYIWNKVLPKKIKPYFEKEWITKNITESHGPLCDIYETNNGAFNAEGDTPSFLYNIPNGLRSMDSPGYGGWGGRYVRVRNNVWMDPLPDSTYKYPEGRWGFDNSWSKKMENHTGQKQKKIREKYFKPIWRWLDVIQKDFAARADWCVKNYSSANHPPVVKLDKTPVNIDVKAGEKILLNAENTFDPDGDKLYFNWWHYREAGTYHGGSIAKSTSSKYKIEIPTNARPGETIHIICEVSDSGKPTLTRYQRVVLSVIP